MANKNRLAQLEKNAPKPKDKQFRQEVRASGNTYFIDGVEVDAAKYHTEHADYVTSRGIERTVNMDVVWCGGGASTGDGSFEAHLLIDKLFLQAGEVARGEGLLADSETFDNCHNDAVRAEIRRRVLAELELQKDGVA